MSKINLVLGNVFDIAWVSSGRNYQGFFNRGKNSIVWIRYIDTRFKSLKIMVATQDTHHDTIAQRIHETLAVRGHEMIPHEREALVLWIKNNRSMDDFTQNHRRRSPHRDPQDLLQGRQGL